MLFHYWNLVRATDKNQLFCVYDKLLKKYISENCWNFAFLDAKTVSVIIKT